VRPGCWLAARKLLFGIETFTGAGKNYREGSMRGRTLFELHFASSWSNQKIFRDGKH
jgi:hypothetical protein